MRAKILLVRSIITLSIVVVLSNAGTANAGYLAGKQVSYEVRDPNLNSLLFGPVTFSVNNTVELMITNTPPIVNSTVQVNDTSMILTFTQAANFAGGSFNGAILRFVSPDIPSLGSATIDSATTLSGFNASDLSFDSKDVFINVAGLRTNAGSKIVLDFAPSSVPEPASMLILGTGVLIAGGIACRYRSARSRNRQSATLL